MSLLSATIYHYKKKVMRAQRKCRVKHELAASVFCMLYRPVREFVSTFTVQFKSTDY